MRGGRYVGGAGLASARGDGVIGRVCVHMHSTDTGADGTATQGDKAPASLLKKPVAKRTANDAHDSDDDEFYDRTASRAKVPHCPELPAPLL